MAKRGRPKKDLSTVELDCFGTRLQTIRNLRGLTQSELAEISGVPVGNIRDYEQQKHEPNWEKVRKLAKALKVTPNSFDSDILLDLKEL